MQLSYEAFLNNYPLEAVEFFETFDVYLNEQKDEYGFKTATLENFAVFEQTEKGLSKKVYNIYLKSVKEIREYLEKGGEL